MENGNVSISCLPCALARQSSIAPYSAGPRLFPSAGTFWGAFLQRSECSYIARCLWSSTSSCIVQSGRPSIIWVLGFALCVGVCFSCFLTCILFGGGGISLSRWSPSQDILQSIYEPETTRNFFLLTQEGPLFPSCCQFFL